MADNQPEPTEPTQDTSPMEGEPVKIPVPRKADVLHALRKAARATEEPGANRRKPEP